MSGFAIQRENMVESQVRTSDVTDRRIIRAMSEIPREVFVASSLRSLAYMDAEITLVPGDGEHAARVMLSPMVLARLLALADVRPGDVVLDVGCASGYSTAILARLAESVVGLECNQGLAEKAIRVLEDQGVDNAAVITGPLEHGCPDQGPFDLIFMNGAVPAPPVQLRGQLNQGGRLVVVLDQGGVGRAALFERIDDTWSVRTTCNASAPILPGFEAKAAFAF